MSEFDYVTRVFASPLEIDANAWDALLALEPDPSPFMRHAYLGALHASGSACAETGWQAQFLTLWRGDELQAACPMYLKSHSYGEYVFDWAWANAYAQHGLDYYPKALVAVPFTPVPGARLLARDAQARTALVAALIDHAQEEKLSSVHLLFGQENDIAACEAAGLMLRHTVQFHWQNEDATTAAPYLSRDFFHRMAEGMPEHWLLFVAEREGQPMACSLIGIDSTTLTAYGRYWGALERVDCLHFEACYYQPLIWCILHGFARFEGGAQGEHKMARALLPVKTTSAHWLAHPAFADAVDRFLQREGQGIGEYLDHLALRNPFKATP